MYDFQIEHWEKKEKCICLLKKTPKQHTHTRTQNLGRNPNPTTKSVREVWRKTFVPSSCWSASFHAWDKLVQKSASPVGFLRNHGKIQREQFGARRISTRKPLGSDLFLWEKLQTKGDEVLVQQHVGFAWMPLVHFPTALQTPSTRQRNEEVTGRQVMVTLLVSSSHTTSSPQKHQEQCCLCITTSSTQLPAQHIGYWQPLSKGLNSFTLFLMSVDRLNSKHMEELQHLEGYSPQPI